MMPKIVWEGNKEEFGTAHQSPPLPAASVKLRDSDNVIGDSLPYGIVPAMICMIVVIQKALFNIESPIEPIYLIPGFVIGMIVALPLHELMHAVCYPKSATVWVGLCLRKLAAYAISYYPLTKSRFIVMSLAPAVLGIIPLVVFIITPIDMKPLLTICFISAFTGLISPSPDYMDMATVLRRVPKNTMIFDSQKGLYYAGKQDLRQ